MDNEKERKNNGSIKYIKWFTASEICARKKKKKGRKKGTVFLIQKKIKMGTSTQTFLPKSPVFHTNLSLSNCCEQKEWIEPSIFGQSKHMHLDHMSRQHIQCYTGQVQEFSNRILHLPKRSFHLIPCV